nr:uncharacterized oxidoreductase YrbE-like [Lytechinus pictus]
MNGNAQRKKIGVALFGVGRAGAIHIKYLAICPRVELRWIVEEDVEKVKPYLDQLYLYDTPVISNKEADKVWNDEKTEAIVVCVPTLLHESIILKGLDKGKAIFVEKPIAVKLTDTRECYLKAARVGKPLFCAFNRRFDPSIRKLRERVQNGEIGQIRCIKTTARDAPFPPIEYLKISGGFYHDCAVHDIDLVLWILGEKPTSIFAQGHAFNDQIKAMNDVDQAAIVLKFPSGIIATIDLNRDAVYGYDQRIEVLGSKGMLQSQNRIEAPLTKHNERGELLDPIFPSFPERYSQSYCDEMDHFLDAVEGKIEKLDVSMEDTLSISWIAELCEQSMHQGKMIPFTKPTF